MPVPKRKRSRARRDKRFANKGLKSISFTTCSNCQTPLRTHQACVACGFYKDAKMFQAKADRTQRRVLEKQSRPTEQQPAAGQE
jgi:large subunit ribosomal protein L32